ncbi:hypothetical protein [Emcibacter sp. SYSU 3D8]|uniref:hypothetical protein n=1 Tax=Emcibacter sp. SYSU 3D8 TaxID=3133969 RepID=UPI0031FEB84A
MTDRVHQNTRSPWVKTVAIVPIVGAMLGLAACGSSSGGAYYTDGYHGNSGGVYYRETHRHDRYDRHDRHDRHGDRHDRGHYDRKGHGHRY